MLYPQNGDRIVTRDSVTLLHPVYRRVAGGGVPVCKNVRKVSLQFHELDL